ncbi:ice-binding family protein [Zhongshania guokunii]|uniref:Ice-binding family protein n=1 Tax=Zhongshania guokunii TaxID=641783 RepID=A0ABV3U5A5_9GAMM
MKLSKKHNGPSLWLACLLPILMTACGSDNNSDNSAVIGASVVATSPADADVDVAINQKIAATFSEEMDAASISTDSFTLIGANEAGLTGVVNLDAGSNSAIFSPDRNLTADTVYTATLNRTIKNTSARPLAADYVWSFTSGATEDSSPPTKSSNKPRNLANGAALNSIISANFNEALDPRTVNTSSFTLRTGLSLSLVTGTVGYDNRVASFSPSGNLSPNTVYTATLTTAITDLAGNPLATDLMWSFTTGTAVAAGPAAVNLRTAADFVILSKSGITNVPTSAISGNIGASPITAAAMDNVFCSEITGTIYGSDAAYTGSSDTGCFAGNAPDNTLVANAVLDMGSAYNDAAGRTTPDFTELHAGDISGQTLVPGLYKWGTSVLISTDVTLSGGSNDVWIFQVAGDITQANDSSIILDGGALAKNIFWQVGGGTGVAVGTDAHFAGIALAAKGITVNTGANINGRLLAQTAVTLDQNTVNQPAP